MDREAWKAIVLRAGHHWATSLFTLKTQILEGQKKTRWSSDHDHLWGRGFFLVLFHVPRSSRLSGRISRTSGSYLFRLWAFNWMSSREERSVFGFFCLVNHDVPPHIELLLGYKGQSIHINWPKEHLDGSGLSKHPGRGKIIGTLTSVPFSGNNYFIYQNSSPPSHLMLEVPGCIITGLIKCWSLWEKTAGLRDTSGCTLADKPPPQRKHHGWKWLSHLRVQGLHELQQTHSRPQSRWHSVPVSQGVWDTAPDDTSLPGW